MKFFVVLLLVPLCLAIPPRLRKNNAKGNNTTATACGVPAIKPDTSGNIVGGVDAIPYSWPWQVALYAKSLFGGSYQLCSGSVISNEWIMSAAHCFYGSENQTDQFTVKLGVFTKADDDEEGEVVLGVSQILINPEYNHNKHTYDISLLKLEKPVDYTDHISPVCLPEVQDEDLPAAGSEVFITGWGDTTEHGTDSPTLKQTNIPLVDDEQCQTDYPYGDYPNVMFCAGLDEGGKDTCQGDSGGPLVYQEPGTGAWKQLGITSWGTGCAEPHHPGVYSRVASYINWIKQNVPDL